jgi:TetR/AcrR family transcriptional regulator, transcriptional repressor for nem operon
VAMETPSDTDTATRILEIGERLLQTRGYNGFSYADIARELGVTKASLHYHFPTKAALGDALIARYAERFATALDEIERAGLSARGELDAYVALYRGVLQHDRMCLCGILAGEHQTLPLPMRDALVRFFDMNETWLAGLLERGRVDGSIPVHGPSVDTARLILSSLEGAMLVARADGDVARFDSTARSLMIGICSPA